MSVNNIYQDYIHVSRYARYIPKQGREKNWLETSKRFREYLTNHINSNNWKIPQRMLDQMFTMIDNKEILPSMRLIMTAGDAADRDNTCVYNCAYLPMDNPLALVELMFILMNGTGVGFSVEDKYVSKWPKVPYNLTYPEQIVYVVEDSREGWAKALWHLLASVFNLGVFPKFDFSLIRPAGAPLKTFGGRASGPQPLQDLLNTIESMLYKRMGKRLLSTDIHDLCTQIAQVVVVGGVRRSALISLGDRGDHGHATLKSGDWYVQNGHRSNANNSAVYFEKPSLSTFLNDTASLYNSFSGERGFWNADAAERKANANGRYTEDRWSFGCNPCSEIILKPREFCNLTTVTIGSDDPAETVLDRIRAATLLGTIQSTFDHFPFLNVLNPAWANNAKEERLLGVSITGIFDNELFHDISDGGKRLSGMLQFLRSEAKVTNTMVAAILGINESKSITCIKPEGTVSSLTGTSAGIHPGYSKFYLRRARTDIKDPVAKLMMDRGIPYEMDKLNPDNVVIFEFPIWSNAKVTGYVNPVEHLKLYSIYQDCWCDHKPSITINYKQSDFLSLCQSLYNNWDKIIGISMLPRDDSIYAQAPYEEISPEQYDELVQKFPKDFNFDDLSKYESEDNTTHQPECTGSSCTIG
jgi:ribonucleoside-diphosphate reductase alpha chain